MNVPTIQMDADVARVTLDRYKAALETRDPTPEDETTILGYKALAEGKQLLDLHQTFRACPLDQYKRPCFAIARASWKWCFYKTADDNAAFAMEQRYLPWSWRHTRARTPKGYIRIPTRCMPREVKRNEEYKAVVPTIPPPIRPKGDLSRYHVLWEAVWEAVPPKDPLLLKKLSGSLYVILAAWDLTPLEQAVLAGRFINET